MNNIIKFPKTLSHQAPITQQDAVRTLEGYANGTFPLDSRTRDDFDRAFALLQEALQRTWDEHRQAHTAQTK